MMGIASRSFGLILAQDRADIPPLFSNNCLITDNFLKAKALNTQFQSVFTKEHSGPLPDKGHSPHPIMPDISITTAGILNLLQNLDMHKASGPEPSKCKSFKGNS